CARRGGSIFSIALVLNLRMSRDFHAWHASRLRTQTKVAIWTNELTSSKLRKSKPKRKRKRQERLWDWSGSNRNGSKSGCNWLATVRKRSKIRQHPSQIMRETLWGIDLIAIRVPSPLIYPNSKSKKLWLYFNN